MTLARTAALLVLAALVASGCSQAVDTRKKVNLYGDSLGVEAAPFVERALTKSGKVSFVNRTRSGTAPCDWRKIIAHDVSTRPPDAALVETYGNNASTCQTGVGGKRPVLDSQEYWAMYRKDLERTVNAFPRSTKVILVSAPAASVDMRSGRSHKKHMLALMRSIARIRPNVTSVDAGGRLERPLGHFARVIPCIANGPCPNHPTRGKAVVRAKDGLHFCPVIVWAKVNLLEHCPVVAYGAWRFGIVAAVMAARAVGTTAYPPPLVKH
ncbi:MAG: hypothetical protein F2799_03605 [Actinobacteria bacterium]|uniref:Unannotated protein n=1 Tax=freshwater metagenome TaxID=449393 RepID=A0A6J7DK78_9ZZZZ|nr:hypothetical protein [Actinomycetota bacterium]